MDTNEILKESTKKLLFEQHSSAGRAYSSQQDGLDRAFTTILFAEIAFYVSKIIPNKEHFWLDLGSVAFIAFSLLMVFILFIKSKATISIYREILEKEIYAIDDPENREEILQKIKYDKQLYNRSNYILSQLNSHIPVLIFISTCLCFLKVSLDDFNIKYKIYLILFLTYIIIGIITFIYTWYKKKFIFQQVHINEDKQN